MFKDGEVISFSKSLFWLSWVFSVACGLSLVAASGLLSARASFVAECRLQGVQHPELCSRALEHRFSSCGAQARLP